ncbi:MAG: 23S rRNA (guanosine(2251)-2'-O)-methyltransferase RlmB [Desulfobacteraceae bacterium]|nr:23S rRNA (guanosine(2251)-2'-O)-methyltransferase RlmB [Desulfobacteraceae bacterium]MCF8095367.1 23S rRNA (guanosine(2251)-2'-O)-methyltransferase RlmB [Desulfobacteraceae bacterium]
MSTRDYSKTETISGIHSVAEALAARRRRIHRIYISRDTPAKRVDKIADHGRRLDIPVSAIPCEELGKMTKNPHHQDIAAKTAPFPLSEFGAMIGKAKKDPSGSFWLIMDSIMDPQNLGALVRSAVCTGVFGIIIPKDRSCAPTPAVSRASAGALEHARLCIVTNLANTMKDLKNNHFWTIGLDQKEARPVYETDMTGACVLVIGGEDTGIRPLVRRHCDFLCRIPQTGPIESLNASVAGGIAMYEAMRQRKTENKKQ